MLLWSIQIYYFSSGENLWWFHPSENHFQVLFTCCAGILRLDYDELHFLPRVKLILKTNEQYGL